MKSATAIHAMALIALISAGAIGGEASPREGASSLFSVDGKQETAKYPEPTDTFLQLVLTYQGDEKIVIRQGIEEFSFDQPPGWISSERDMPWHGMRARSAGMVGNRELAKGKSLVFDLDLRSYFVRMTPGKSELPVRIVVFPVDGKTFKPPIVCKGTVAIEFSHGTGMPGDEQAVLKFYEGIRLFMGDTVDKRRQQSVELRHDRSQVIRCLTSLLTIEDSSAEARKKESRQYYAVMLLGQIHATEAISVLLDRIDLRFNDVDDKKKAETDSEVVTALAAIGKPASVAALERLTDGKDAAKNAIYARVIALVEGGELGREMVKLRAAKEENPARKAQLLKSIDLFGNAATTAR